MESRYLKIGFYWVSYWFLLVTGVSLIAELG